jgi:hypothetical protein
VRVARVDRNLLALALGWVQKLVVRLVAGSSRLASVSRSWSSSALGPRAKVALVTRTWLSRPWVCSEVFKLVKDNAAVLVVLCVVVYQCVSLLEGSAGGCELDRPVQAGCFVNAAW